MTRALANVDRFPDPVAFFVSISIDQITRLTPIAINMRSSHGERGTITSIRNLSTRLVSLVLELHIVARLRGFIWCCVGRQLARSAAAVAGQQKRGFGAACSEEAWKYHQVSNDDACGYLAGTKEEGSAAQNILDTQYGGRLTCMLRLATT